MVLWPSTCEHIVFHSSLRNYGGLEKTQDIVPKPIVVKGNSRRMPGTRLLIPHGYLHQRNRASGVHRSSSIAGASLS